MTKRGYKLQEFVAHSSNVNCLRIGKKACRLFLTGGDDYKVNLWSIGKPNFLMSLCGHISPVESVAFDASENLVLGGASSGVIKLWDLEEAKMVRGLTGHRSNCTAVEFHPFGEFFATGSIDTNLKIWDIRKQGCIHTYKGHIRGISTIKFTPDGRWVVSGGYDNVVKVWDLTAGKLLHDFKFHENHIRTIDFHPLEFLMATGSADRTVKYWDLETFELIGSSRPEGSGVHAITFHPDGRALFCGLEESLKVYSWEPVICHDTVDMGWSSLGDLCIHEGKIVGCSYYQNSVGVWAADTSLIEPFAKGRTDHQFNLSGSHSPAKVESGMRSSSGVRCASPDYETKEIKNIYVDTYDGKPVSLQQDSSVNSSKVLLPTDLDQRNLTAQSPRHDSLTAFPEKTYGHNISLAVPNIVSPDSSDGRDALHSRKDSFTFSRTKPGMLLRPAHSRRPSGSNYSVDRLAIPSESPDIVGSNRVPDRHLELNSEYRDTAEDEIKESSERKFRNIKTISRTILLEEIPKTEKEFKSESMVNYERAVRASSEKKLPSLANISEKMTSVEITKVEKGDESVVQSRENNSMKIVRGVTVMSGRTRTLVEKFEKRERLNIVEEQGAITSSTVTPTVDNYYPPAPGVDLVEKKESSSGNESHGISIPSVTATTLDRTPITAAPLAESLKRRDGFTAHPSANNFPSSQFDFVERKESSSSNENHGVSIPSGTTTTLDRTPVTAAPLAEILKRRDGFTSHPAANNSPSFQFDFVERKESSSSNKSHGVSIPSGTPTTLERTPVMAASLAESLKIIDRFTAHPAADDCPSSRFDSVERKENSSCSQSRGVSTPSCTSATSNRKPVAAAPLPESFKRRDRSCINVQPIVVAPDVPRVTPISNEKLAPEVEVMEEREFELTGYWQNSMPQNVANVSMQSNKPQVSGRIEYNSESFADVMEALLQSHEVFLSNLRSRLTKLQVVRHFWERKDVKGAINALKRLPDHSVHADVIIGLTGKMEILNLDLFSCLLPVLVGLLDSKIERHAVLSMEMLMKLVAVFGPVVRSTISAHPSVGVDLHAEERLECCNQCWTQLQKIQKILPLFVRRGGLLAKSAQELNLVMQQP